MWPFTKTEDVSVLDDLFITDTTREVSIGDIYITDLSGWKIPLNERSEEFSRIKVLNINNDASIALFKYLIYRGKAQEDLECCHDTGIVKDLILERSLTKEE